MLTEGGFLMLLDPIKRVLRKRKAASKIIDTTVTIKTKYLVENVANYANFNKKLAILAFATSFLTCIPVFRDSIPLIQEAIRTKKENNEGIVEFFMHLPFMDILLVIISFVTLCLTIYALLRLFALYNPVKFVNKIVSDQYDSQEYTAIFIIKRMIDNTPKVLVYKSQSWNSFFLPYCHYNPDDLINKKADDFLKDITFAIADQLEINPSEIVVHDSFTKNDYVAIKAKPNHIGMLRINYRFYYITFAAPYVANKFLTKNSSHFTWKSKYELGKDVDTQLNNGDVLQIMDSLSLITQSKSAFFEMYPKGFDIGTSYRVIWNITNRCDYNCPICATNSGKNNKDKLDKETKLKILRNLATINGHLDTLDISGGDPLYSSEDREVIREANNILAFTRVSVTTTGRALQKVPFDEIVRTVKNCEVTYDTPYNICNEKLQDFREYEYNRDNYKALERFVSSGIKIDLRVNVPLLPALAEDKRLIQDLLKQIYAINPTSVKFIRLMPVGRCTLMSENSIENDKNYLTLIEEIVDQQAYKFETTPNCSLGVRIKKSTSEKNYCRQCEMLTHKLGIDCNGHVYSCIWGAYIKQFCSSNASYEENPFYLGDLKENSMYTILTDAKTQKILQKLNSIDWNKSGSCRVCAYVQALEQNKCTLAKEGSTYEKRMQNFEDMLAAEEKGDVIISGLF